MRSQGKPPLILNLLILAGAVAGFSINGLLLGRRLAGGGLAGCGGGSACEELLNSRWSQVFGIPVTAFGLLVYLATMVAITATGRRLLGPCLGVIAGAAAWFILVQALLIGRFCPWCMTAHGIGAAVVLLGWRRLAIDGGAVAAGRAIGLSAIAAALVVSLLQVIGPPPVTHRVDEMRGGGAAPRAAIHARGTGRKVEFAGGRKSYDVAALPHLGPADAKRVMVEYFDYSCGACQTMGGYLDALLARHPADLCVVILPVPLERSCNHALAAGQTEHPGACELTRLALVRWRTRPAGFAALHHALLGGAPVTAARAMVQQHIPPAELAAAMQDPWLDELIEANIRDWVAFSAGNNTLPQLLIRGTRILHGLPSGEADFIRVLERELGL